MVRKDGSSGRESARVIGHPSRSFRAKTMSTNETRTQDSTAIIEASDDGVILDDSPDWEGPFTEYNQYGEPTGYAYVRCPECGVEVLEADTSTASHRPACRFE